VVSLAAMALFFVLIQRTKNQVNPEASLPHWPLLFCPFSGEADGLTGKGDMKYFRPSK